MEGRSQEQLVKVSVVTGVNNIQAVVWRKGGTSVMSEQDVDDVAFLTGIANNHSAQITYSICQSSTIITHNLCHTAGVPGTDSPAGQTKKSLYENNGVAACSQKKALFITAIVFALLLTVALIIAYTGPQSGNIFFLILYFPVFKFSYWECILNSLMKAPNKIILLCVWCFAGKFAILAE